MLFAQWQVLTLKFIRSYSRKGRSRAAASFLLLLLTGWILMTVKLQPDSNRAAPYPDLPKLRIMIASDLHFISPLLTDHGEYFTRLTQQADGKVMRWSEELMDAFVYTVLKERPDALVLTGDLTFNGARQSHIDLAAKLSEIQNAGIPVLVLPGNHDLNSENAARFAANTFERVQSINAAEFEQIYGNYGFSSALSKDSESSSFVWECAPGLRFLMLDVNGTKAPNRAPASTLRWLEQQLRQAQRDGSRILAFSHQNLLPHSMFIDGYVIENSNKILDLYEKNEVWVNFTGHLHLQHIAEQHSFREIATSALSIAPNQYAILELKGKELHYQTASVDVSEWARTQKRNEPELLHFTEYAKDFFLSTGRNQALGALSGLADSEQQTQLADYFAEMNYTYFSGALDQLALQEDLLYAWKCLDAFQGYYLDSILQQERKNHNFCTIFFS